MTGLPVRDTQFAKWIDPNAWREKMPGPRWTTLLQEEDKQLKQITRQAPIQERLGPFRAAYEAIHDNFQTVPYQCGPAQVSWHNQFTKSWYYTGSKIKHDARDIVSKGSTVLVNKRHWKR